MTEKVEIFVQLFDEKVDVWRPVWAAPIGDGAYEILPQEYDSALETWAFEPGARVLCEYIDSDDGRILAAVHGY